MITINGIKLGKTGFENQKIGDLLYFEGPLLSLFIDKYNPDVYYLYKWTDRNETANRRLITQVRTAELRHFFDKKVTLKALLTKNPLTFILDLDEKMKEKQILVCETDDIPKTYLPDGHSFFDENTFSPFANNFKQVINKNRLDYLLKEMQELVGVKKAS